MIELAVAFQVLKDCVGEKAEGLTEETRLTDAGLDSADLLEWIVMIEDETDTLLELDVDDIDVSTMTLAGFVSKIRVV